MNTNLNFSIPVALVFQLEVYYKVDRLLIGLTAHQIGTTDRWYSNKTSMAFKMCGKISILPEILAIPHTIFEEGKSQIDFSSSFFRVCLDILLVLVCLKMFLWPSLPVDPDFFKLMSSSTVVKVAMCQNNMKGLLLVTAPKT